MFNINYGIVLLRAGSPPEISEVLHFVGYEEPPCEVDFKILWEELENDPEFGFVGQLEGTELAEAPPEIVAYFREQVGPIPNEDL